VSASRGPPLTRPVPRTEAERPSLPSQTMGAEALSLIAAAGGRDGRSVPRTGPEPVPHTGAGGRLLEAQALLCGGARDGVRGQFSEGWEAVLRVDGPGSDVVTGGPMEAFLVCSSAEVDASKFNKRISNFLGGEEDGREAVVSAEAVPGLV